MRLQCLAGAYAGQVREYGPIAGLAALQVGTAARIGDTGPARPIPVSVPQVEAKAAIVAAPPLKRRQK